MAVTRTSTKMQRDAHLAEVARLDRRGHTQHEIARRLGVSQPQISYDLKVVHEAYKEQMLPEREAMVSEKIHQLRDLRAAAWEAYERSALDKSKVVEEYLPVEPPTEEKGEGEKAGKPRRKKHTGGRRGQTRTIEESMIRLKRIVTTEGRLPANEYLTTILKTVEMECMLLGLEAPKKTEGSNTLHVIDWNAVLGGLAAANPAKVEQRLEELILEDLKPKE